MRAAVYARVSTTRQAQAQTIEQQLDRCTPRRPSAAGRWTSSTSIVTTAIAVPAWADQDWTGCVIMRRWPIWMLSW
jgi:hypothetical protein